MAKWVYTFGNGEAEGNGSQKNLLGGKGANLAEMCSLGLPVPPGLTITTEVCTSYFDNEKQYPSDLEVQINDAIKYIENILGKGFGDEQNPLLVSVRSGARASMPGMMDTILNLGLNDKTVQGLATKSGNERFAFDSYRRFIQMYSDVVLETDHYLFEEVLDLTKLDKGVTNDTDLDTNDLKKIIAKYKEIVKSETGRDFPQDVKEQLWGAVGAVFSSWMNPRAITYRKMYDIPASWGTAVNVQAMVFGNMGETSATGVAFTRDPSTGDKKFFGEYLINAQGEDVVAGIRTPQQVTIVGKNEQDSDLPAMEETMPVVYNELVEIYKKLEKHYRDMQDIEFTVEEGKLWMLQTRNGKRTSKAAIKIAVDMVNEGLIDKDEAILRVDPDMLDKLLHPTLDPKAEKKILAKGLPASPGAASGIIVLTADKAQELAADNKDVILVRTETSPEDIHGMDAARGILTSRGGMTSHAAVVARGMGRPCISGAGDIRIDLKAGTVNIKGKILHEGDLITIDGGTGEVIEGSVKTIDPELSGDFEKIMQWADETRRLKVRTNAETPKDASTARKFGAEGIGLCRTEHMFFDAERIIAIRQMIMAETKADREKAINKLLPYQKADFKEIFYIMQGLPVTVRLLDPPLHEFIPHSEKEFDELAASLGLTVEKIKSRALELAEQNPMLGHRGCRLGITYPEIYTMQVKAIIEAAIEVKQAGQTVLPEIMIPLVSTRKELAILKDLANKTIQTVFDEKNDSIEYMIGTMIELPRAALTADEIAQEAEFFSFGTNDLTQTTLGISRDDSASFIGEYVDKAIFEKDPFAVLDRDGVGSLIKMAKEKGRSVNPAIKLGICGEHGGNPSSVEFCNEIGLDYVSCSPYRVPIARLAAAQAVIKQKNSPSNSNDKKKEAA